MHWNRFQWYILAIYEMLECLKMVIIGKLVIFEMILVHQTINGDPNDGQDESEPSRSYLNHIPTWYKKMGKFLIEILI